MFPDMRHELGSAAWLVVVLAISALGICIVAWATSASLSELSKARAYLCEASRTSDNDNLLRDSSRPDTYGDREAPRDVVPNTDMPIDPTIDPQNQQVPREHTQSERGHCDSNPTHTAVIIESILSVVETVRELLCLLPIGQVLMTFGISFVLTLVLGAISALLPAGNSNSATEDDYLFPRPGQTIEPFDHEIHPDENAPSDLVIREDPPHIDFDEELPGWPESYPSPIDDGELDIDVWSEQVPWDHGQADQQ